MVIHHVMHRSRHKHTLCSITLILPLLTFQIDSIRTPSYIVLDLIKIYGRLSQRSRIGHIIPLRNDDKVVSKLINPEKIYWELMFDKNEEELNFDKFAERLQVKHFDWPFRINNQRKNDKSPFYIPVRQENYNKLFKLVENLPELDKPSNYKILHLNAMVSNQEIDREALLDVFNIFSSDNILTKKSFEDRIRSYSPLLALWDWDSFIENMNQLD